MDRKPVISRCFAFIAAIALIFSVACSSPEYYPSRVDGAGRTSAEVRSVAPRNGERDVIEQVVVIIGFTAPVLFSIDNLTVVSDTNPGEVVEGMLFANNSQTWFTFSPKRLLFVASRYTCTLRGVRDEQGRELYPITWSFDTELRPSRLLRGSTRPYENDSYSSGSSYSSSYYYPSYGGLYYGSSYSWSPYYYGGYSYSRYYSTPTYRGRREEGRRDLSPPWSGRTPALAGSAPHGPPKVTTLPPASPPRPITRPTGRR